MTETRRFSPQRLRGLFEPQSIALVGASDKSSWSMMVHNNLTLGEYTGRIYYINPRNPAVHGRPAVPRLADIGEPVDLAYIMVPGEAVLPVVREMAEAGIHNAIVLTAGFAEQDEEGLLVGVVRDPVWGQVMAVGLGGIWIEILKDTSLRVLPVSRRDVYAMLDELQGKALLHGARGSRSADLDALVEVIYRISRLAHALESDLESLELNPLRVDGSQVEALDALITWRE